jgi:hypothetical protein
LFDGSSEVGHYVLCFHLVDVCLECITR